MTQEFAGSLRMARLNHRIAERVDGSRIPLADATVWRVPLSDFRQMKVGGTCVRGKQFCTIS